MHGIIGEQLKARYPAYLSDKFYIAAVEALKDFGLDRDQVVKMALEAITLAQRDMKGGLPRQNGAGQSSIAQEGHSGIARSKPLSVDHAGLVREDQGVNVRRNPNEQGQQIVAERPTNACPAQPKRSVWDATRFNKASQGTKEILSTSLFDSIKFYGNVSLRQRTWYDIKSGAHNGPLDRKLFDYAIEKNIVPTSGDVPADQVFKEHDLRVLFPEMQKAAA